MKKLQINWLLWIQGLLFVAAAVLVVNAVINIDTILTSVRTFFGIVSPIIVAAAMAYVLCRPCNWVENWLKKSKYQIVEKRARGLAVLLVYVTVIGIVYAVLSALLPLLISNIMDFIDAAPYLFNQVREAVMDIQWNDFDGVLDIRETVDTFFNDFDIQTVVGPLTQSLGAITNFAISTAFWLFNFTLALVISIYLLLYKDAIFETVDRITDLLIKKERKKMIKYYVKQADDLFYKFIGAQFLDACILGGLSMLLLWASNVRFAAFLGILLGVANMIPKFGAIVASVIVIILSFVTGGVSQGIWIAVLLTVLQQLDGNVIGPMIMGDALKINPILVFFALLVGGAYFGFVGIFLSIPAMALVKIIVINIIEAKETMTHHSDQVATKIWQE